MRKLLVVFVTVFGLSLILWVPAHAIDTKYPTNVTYIQTFMPQKGPILIPQRVDNQQKVIPVEPKEEDKEAYKKKGS